jgi:MFS family permease
MEDFIGGAVMMSYAVIALFFLRFWKQTRDRLLGVFSVAFWLMALVRPLLIAGHIKSEHYHYVYLLRLLAYALIVYAIVDKNRSE